MPISTVIVIGVGNRGRIYADFAIKHSDRLKVVGVAEPREFYRTSFAKEHCISAKKIFSCWRALSLYSQKSAD